MTSLADLRDENDFLDADDRYRLLIDLGRALEPMPDALKTEATLVRGCSASVWVYPTRREDGTLLPGGQQCCDHQGDHRAGSTDGAGSRAGRYSAATDIEGELASFDLKNQLSSNRTQGIPNMIALIRETAARYV